MDFTNPPYLVRSSDTLNHVPLRDIHIESVSPVPFPPWHLESPEVCLDLHQMCPKSNPPPLSKAIATEYIERNCSQSLNIYTDGSKTPDGDTGAAFVVPALKVSKGFRLPAHVSVFTCELIAILMSLFFCRTPGLSRPPFSLTLSVPSRRFCILADAHDILLVKSFTSTPF
jgi:hypothetical protein